MKSCRLARLCRKDIQLLAMFMAVINGSLILFSVRRTDRSNAKFATFSSGENR